MKQNYFKLIVLTAFLLFANAGAQAQALIHWNAIGWQTTNPEDLSRGGYFFIKDINPIAQVAVLPVGNTVTDFRVKNDSVFFCGMDNTYGYGIVGFFDINALFAGTGTITYGILQQTVSSPYVTRPTRMDVYTFRGITHIAFVGDLLTNVPGSPTLVPSTTVGDAYFDNYFSTWNIDFYQNAGCDMIYTDIAASSDYVVAVAKKNFSPDYFVHVFRISGDFLSSPIGANNVFQITGNVPMGDILLEDISATDFVLAYHFAVAGGPGTELQQFRVDPVTPTIIIQLSRSLCVLFPSMGHEAAELRRHRDASAAVAGRRHRYDAERGKQYPLLHPLGHRVGICGCFLYPRSIVEQDGCQVHRRLLGDRRQRRRDCHSRGILSCRALHVLPNQVHAGLRNYTRSAGNQQVPRPACSVIQLP